MPTSFCRFFQSVLRPAKEEHDGEARKGLVSQPEKRAEFTGAAHP